MRHIVIAVLFALVAGTILGSRFLAVPLRSFSVDREGNQHCAGLRHGEKFEVFCLSTDRPFGESMSKDLDRTFNPPAPPYRQNLAPYTAANRPVPAAEDHAAPWKGRP